MKNLERYKLNEMVNLAKEDTDNRICLIKTQVAQKTAERTSKTSFVVVLCTMPAFSLLFFGFMLTNYCWTIKLSSHSNVFTTAMGFPVLLMSLFIILSKQIFLNRVKHLVTTAFFANKANTIR